MSVIDPETKSVFFFSYREKGEATKMRQCDSKMWYDKDPGEAACVWWISCGIILESQSLPLFGFVCLTVWIAKMDEKSNLPHKQPFGTCDTSSFLWCDGCGVIMWWNSRFLVRNPIWVNLTLQSGKPINYKKTPIVHQNPPPFLVRLVVKSQPFRLKKIHAEFLCPRWLA